MFQSGLAWIVRLVKAQFVRFTDVQRDKLCQMIEMAFLEIRMLTATGKAEQASDLADAFHNLPMGMWKEDFDLKTFRDDFLAEYQKKYADALIRNYVKMVNEAMGLEGVDPSNN